MKLLDSILVIGLKIHLRLVISENLQVRENLNKRIIPLIPKAAKDLIGCKRNLAILLCVIIPLTGIGRVNRVGIHINRKPATTHSVLRSITHFLSRRVIRLSKTAGLILLKLPTSETTKMESMSFYKYLNPPQPKSSRIWATIIPSAIFRILAALWQCLQTKLVPTLERASSLPWTYKEKTNLD